MRKQYGCCSLNKNYQFKFVNLNSSNDIKTTI